MVCRPVRQTSWATSLVTGFRLLSYEEVSAATSSGWPDNRFLDICSSRAQTAATPGRVLSIASRANAKSLHASWPIRASCPSCANQDAWTVVTPKRPEGILGHVHTRAPSHNITLKAVPFQIQVIVPIICLWPSCLSLFGLDKVSLYIHSPIGGGGSNFVFSSSQYKTKMLI